MWRREPTTCRERNQPGPKNVADLFRCSHLKTSHNTILQGLTSTLTPSSRANIENPVHPLLQSHHEPVHNPHAPDNLSPSLLSLIPPKPPPLPLHTLYPDPTLPTRHTAPHRRHVRSYRTRCIEWKPVTTFNISLQHLLKKHTNETFSILEI